MLDHILVSSNLLSKLNGFDVVHINSEFADRSSDRDPLIARFYLPAPNLAPTAVNFTNAVTTLAENTSTNNRIKVADITIADDGQGSNILSLSGADASFFELDSNVLYLKQGTPLNFEAKASYAVTVTVDDPIVGNTPDASSTFTLEVGDVNEAPTANDDTGFTANQSVSELIPVADLLANDTDPDANTTLSILTDGFSEIVGGSIALNGSNVVFTPNPTFRGQASFKYTVTDGSLTSQATVTLVVGRTVNGSNGSDLLTGNGGDDNFDGRNGDNILLGNRGNDTLLGGNGTDVLWGGEGDDLLKGDNGTDILWGGEGNDTLVGGSGNDTLSGRQGSDRFDIAANTGTDTIADFSDGSDLIGLLGGLSFAQLTVGQGTGVNRHDTLIRLSTNTTPLIILKGEDATNITAGDFVVL